MKRRTAYKIYRAFLLFIDARSASEKLFGADDANTIRQHAKEIARSLGMTQQSMSLKWNYYCRCNVDRFHRMMLKVDRDIYSPNSTVKDWLRYGFSKMTRQRRKVEVMVWQLANLSRELGIIEQKFAEEKGTK